MTTLRAKPLSIFHFCSAFRTFFDVLCSVEATFLFCLLVGGFALFYHILDVRFLDDVADNMFGVIRLRNFQRAVWLHHPSDEFQVDDS